MVRLIVMRQLQLLTNFTGVQLTNEPFDGNATLYDIAYTVTAKVKNTGSKVGCEIAQMVGLNML
jgi:hypothetical protein